MNKLENWFKKMPVIAILRGIKPSEVVAVGSALYEAGIGIIEVPLNSPEPLVSIEKLAKVLGNECVIGAGTVLSETDVTLIANAGGEIVVAPNTNIDVIQKSIALGLTPMPGWSSATEAFAAYQAGARYLKLFPATTYGTQHVRAIRAVLPTDSKLLAVGGISADATAEWLQAGIDGFGIGTEIYTPGASIQEVCKHANSVVAKIQNILL